VPIHTLFDLLAASASLLATYLCIRWRWTSAARIESFGVAYVIALVAGAVIGGYGAGTLNLYLSGMPAFGRSIAGGLAGAIMAIELLKLRRGVTQSTGLVFVPAFTASVIVGRLGCYFSGLQDNTYGVPTSLAWGHDFGDGIFRHPVQLYESGAMLAFGLVAARLLARRQAFFLHNGFYLMVLAYAVQRFAWEFLKPYQAIAGPFNLFHFICGGLACYALAMTGRRHERTTS
jgi:phosphatidylglycerol---prolipoprotein diacylglyceryl transferase